MKLILSFNGVDGSGKTTQLDLFAKENPDIIERIGGGGEYPPFSNPPQKDFDWWFKNSSPEEFTDVIYKSLQARNIDIKKSKKPIIIVDKGIKNFDARVMATLIYKGINQEEAKKLILEAKEKHGIEALEDINIFFNIAKTVKLREQITRKREFSGLIPEKTRIYSEYQHIQNKVIEEQLKNGEYEIVDASR